jgi:octaprenyl-diphosphate synthase
VIYETTLQQIFAPIQKEMEELKDFCKKIIRHTNSSVSAILSGINLSEGKKLRPAMVFLSAGIVGKINPLTQITAFGLELLHYSSLLHDDVVDNGYKRHNQPTLNAVWNNKIAVLAGDYLLSEGMSIIAKENHHKLLSKLISITKSMAYGELLQLNKSDNILISEQKYMEIICCKTASLISACFEMGTTSCTSDEKIISQWKKFGKEVGIIFQLKDDLLDYQSDNISPKDAHKDIKEHKITLPFIAALQQTTDPKKQQLLDLYKSHNGNNSEIQAIIRFVTKHGGINYTENLIDKKTNQCLDFVKQQAESNYKQSLLLLIQFIRDRKF